MDGNAKTSSFGPHSILSFFREILQETINVLFPSQVITEGTTNKQMDCGIHTCPLKILAATQSMSCVGNRIMHNYREIPYFGGFMFNMAHGSEMESLECVDYFFMNFSRPIWKIP